MRSPRTFLLAVLILSSLPVSGANDGEGAPTCPDGAKATATAEGTYTCPAAAPTCEDGSAAVETGPGEWMCVARCEDGSTPTRHEARDHTYYTCGPEYVPPPPSCGDGSNAVETAPGEYACIACPGGGKAVAHAGGAACPAQDGRCVDGTAPVETSEGALVCPVVLAPVASCPEGTFAVESKGETTCRENGWVPPCPEGFSQTGVGGEYRCERSGCPPSDTEGRGPSGEIVCYSPARPGACPPGADAVETPRGWICQHVPSTCGEGLALQTATDGWKVCMFPCAEGGPVSFANGAVLVCPEDVDDLDFEVCGDAIFRGCLPPPKEIPYCAEGLPSGVSCIPAPTIVEGEYLTPAEACRIAASAEPQDLPEACAEAWFAPLPPDADETAVAAWRRHVADAVPEGAVDALSDTHAAWSTVDDGSLAKLKAMAVAHELFGVAAFDGRTLDGSFVDLSFGETGLVVEAYSVDGVVFFDRIAPVRIVGGEARTLEADLATAGGASLVAAGGDALLETHDAHNGATVYRALGAPYDVVIDLAEGARIEEASGALFVAVGDRRVAVLGGARVVDGSTVRIAVEPGQPLTILRAPDAVEGDRPRGTSGEIELDLIEAIAEGELGAQIAVVASDAGAIHDVVSYDGVRVGVQELTDEALAFTVGREDPEGSAVLFSFARTMLDVGGEEIRVLVDGEELSVFGRVDELTVAAGDGTAGYFASDDGSVVRVVVRFARFSEHLVRIEEERAASSSPTPTTATPPGTDPAAPTAATPASPVALALLGVAGLALARRRRA